MLRVWSTVGPGGVTRRPCRTVTNVPANRWKVSSVAHSARVSVSEVIPARAIATSADGCERPASLTAGLVMNVQIDREVALALALLAGILTFAVVVSTQ
jgi:hypothetical protein